MVMLVVMMVARVVVMVKSITVLEVCKKNKALHESMKELRDVSRPRHSKLNPFRVLS